MLTTDHLAALDAMTVPQLTRTIGEALRIRDLELIGACVVRVHVLDPDSGAIVEREVRTMLRAAVR